MFGGIQMVDYEAAGYQNLASDQAQELLKALSAGSAISVANQVGVPGDGSALRMESLERTLRTTAFKMRDLRFYKMLTGIPAFNTVEQFNLIREYGQGGVSGFFSEGGLPNETDATYERKSVEIKFMGVVRRATHPMLMVKAAHGDVVANETINGSLDLLRKIERGLFKADSSIVGLEFDGLDKQIADGAPAANIIDLRGGPLNEDVLTDAALTVSDAPNFGIPTDIQASPTRISDLFKQFYPRQRMDLPNPENGLIGLSATGIMTQAGPVRFQPNPFVDDGGAPGTAAGDANRRPLTPTVAVALVAAGAGSQFVAADNGTYNYAAVALNEHGRSDPVDVGSVALVAGNSVTFTLQAAGGRVVRGYEIYRTENGGAQGTERLIQRVAATAGGFTTVITDANAKLPGTTDAYMIQGDTENLSLKNLAPMMRIPLALIDLSLRWAQVSYFALACYTPQKNTIIRNIGRSPT